MDTAKIFQNGSSQAVQLPKAFQFKTDTVLAHKIGNVVLLLPRDSAWDDLAKSLACFTEDYMTSREQPSTPQQRKAL